MTARSQQAGHDLRRVAQTPRTFANWPALLKDLAAEKLGRGAAELQFRTRDGLVLRCPNVPGARLPLYEQYADDCYRLEWFLGDLVHGALRVLDVGSHIGAFAVNVARRHAGTHVDCYEPSPQSGAYLRRNAAANGLSDRITVHEAALAGFAGTALLDDNTGASVHNGLVRDDRRLVDGDDAAGARRTLEVRTETFDAAVAAAGGAVDVVKMDCEGGEYELVRASSPESWRAVQRVVMEYHPVPGESWPALRDRLADLGLRPLAEEVTGPGLGTAWLSR